MATQYPAAIDTVITLPTISDLTDPVSAEDINILRDAILSVESELGIKPSGVYTTVRARLDALQDAIQSFSGTFATGGDLSGTSTNQTVIGLQGHAISAAAPTNGQVLTWNGNNWSPTTLSAAFTAAGDLSGTAASQTVIGIQGRTVSASAPSSGQALMWNGSLWTPNVAFTAGGDLSGSSASQTVTGIQSRPVSGTAPSSSQIYSWSGAAWAPQFIVDSNVSASAAIAGTKISPNFGSQNISTTGTLNGGATTVTGLTVSTLSTGIGHYDSSGVLTSSLIVNADVSVSAAIAGTKISPNFGSQTVQTTGTVQGNILGVNNGSTVPTITSGTGVPSSTPPNGSVYLRADGGLSTSVYVYESGWTALGGAGAGGPPTGSAGGDLTGTYPNPTVASLTGSAGVVSIPTAALAFGTGPATTGEIRLENNGTGIKTRTNNSFDETLLKMDASNIITIGSFLNGGMNINLTSGGAFNIYQGAGNQAFAVSNTTIFGWSGTTQTLQVGRSSSDFIALGGAPSTTGVIRLTNNTQIKTKDQNGNDANLIYMDNFGGLNIADSSRTNSVTVSAGAGAFQYVVGGQRAIYAHSAATYVLGPLSGDPAYGTTFRFGVSAITMGTDANITLSAAQSVNPFLRMTSGVSLTATRNIVLTLADGATSLVHNNTTGSQSLQFIGSTGTGATVVNGARQIIYSDATNYYGLAPQGIFNGTSSDFLALGSSPAKTGAVRISNNSAVYGRNNANTNDLVMIAVTTSDNIQIGDNTSVNQTQLFSKSGVTGNVNGTNVFSLAGNSSDFIAIGDMPSAIGSIRLNNNTSGQIWARNAANNANILLAYIDSANEINIGDVGNASVIYTTTSTGHHNFYANTTLGLTVDSSGVSVGAAGSYGGGVGMFCLPNATTIPTTNPTSAYVEYSNAGVPELRSSQGHVTQYGFLGSGTANTQTRKVYKLEGTIREAGIVGLTTLLSFAIPNNTSCLIETYIVGRTVVAGSGAVLGDSCSAKFTDIVKNASGSASSSGNLQTLRVGDASVAQGNTNTAVSISGTNYLVQVAVEISCTIDWEAWMTVYVD